jgi:hypothetical protein
MRSLEKLALELSDAAEPILRDGPNMVGAVSGDSFCRFCQAPCNTPHKCNCEWVMFRTALTRLRKCVYTQR